MSYEASAGRGSVMTQYGPRSTERRYGGATAGEHGEKRKLEFVFDYDELPAGSTGLEPVIPAGAYVVDSAFDVITAFTSTSTTTDLQVGVTDADGGSDITDVDGLLTAANLTQTVIADTGRAFAGTGSGVLFNEPLVEDARITVTPTVADLTAGKARLVIEYVLIPTES